MTRSRDLPKLFLGYGTLFGDGEPRYYEVKVRSSRGVWTAYVKAPAPEPAGALGREMLRDSPLHEGGTSIVSITELTIAPPYFTPRERL